MRFYPDTYSRLSQLMGCALPAFAYRLPNENVVYGGVCMTSDVREIGGEDSLFFNDGYIFAPFLYSSNTLYFLKSQPKIIDSLDLDSIIQYAKNKSVKFNINQTDSAYESYKKQVDYLVDAMKRGEIGKAVLSRTVTVERPALSDADIFCCLSEKYPTAFVNWVHIPGVGKWMGATPETLLDYNGERLETMALAGTRPAGSVGDWGEKEKEEQQIVTDYIYNLFREFAPNAELGERFTRRAGQVEHLCTPIRAKGNFDRETLGRLVAALHPTPAVGGFPKAEALRLIQQVEKHDRKYYSGYCGPVTENGVRLFVNLRCMELDDHHLRLYVGGGLTAQSQPESEWQETEAKAQTLLSVIQDK